MTNQAIAAGITLDLVSRALDAATLRHTVHSSNVANASMPGYQPVRVSFEDQLGLVRHDLLARNNDIAAQRALKGIEPRLELNEVSDAGVDEKVRLDIEVSSMMQNAVWYQSLLTALNKSSSILRLAIRDGRS